MKKIIILAMITTLATGLMAENKVVTEMSTMNVAGQQRMLSQRIAKDYLAQGIGINKAEKEFTDAMKKLKSNHVELNKAINNNEIKNLLMFVEMSSEDMDEIAKEEYSTDNAQIVIDLSETMLEGSQYVVKSLDDQAKVKSIKIVDTAGRQRMLSQRIAKYYIAYQAGIKDKNTIDQMKAAVKEFSDAQVILMNNQTNTPEINKRLKKIDRLWKIVYKFYLGIEKGGLPLIVFNTTNDITKQMNIITGLYVNIETPVAQ